MTSDTTERRRFSRINFNASVELQQGDRCWTAHVIDISLKGLLCEQPDQCGMDCNQPLLAIVRLTDHTSIDMTVSLTHTENRQLGFRCESIDLDSISHLRRLIELNLGDPAAAERELSDLVSSGSTSAESTSG